MPLNIVFLQSSLWLSGGARVVIALCNHLGKRGHQVTIIIPRDAIDPEMEAEFDPEVTIRQASYPLIKPAIKSTSLWKKIRITLSMTTTVPRCDLIVATHTPTTMVSLLAGRVQKKGLPVWLYQDYPEMFKGRPTEAWLLRHALSWHRGALVVSHYSAQELGNISPGEVRYIGDAISHYDVFSAGRKPIKPEKQIKQIMYLGDFRPRKGLSDFLKAAETVYKSIPNIELLLVLKQDGEFETSVPFKKILRPDTAALAQHYSDSDLFVSSSWHEGFGLPPLEAMACGTPVVLTDSGGVRDYARSGENCLMVPPKDTQKLAKAITNLLSDQALMERFQHNGPLTASEYTWEKVVDRLEAALFDFLR